MHRIDELLSGLENRLIYLASQEEVSATERETLLPVLSSHLTTVNRWRLAKLALTK